MEDNSDAVIGLAHGIGAMLGAHLPNIAPELFNELTVDITNLVIVLIDRHPEWMQWQVRQVIGVMADVSGTRLGYEQMAAAVVEQYPVGARHEH